MIEIDEPTRRAPSSATLQQAAQWYALLRGGSASEADRRAWADWLAARAEHRHAWQQVEAISRGFEPLQAPAMQGAAVVALRQTRGARVSRRHVINGLALVGGTGGLGWLALREGGLMGPWQAWAADYASATGEVRELALADGTQLWLNTASAVDVDLSGAERRMRLLAGEVLVSSVATTNADARPLLIQSTQGTLRAEGTRFNLRLEGATTLLTVFDGTVNLNTASTRLRRRVPAGEQVRFDAQRITASAPADVARQSWTRGVLLAQDIPLGELIGELGRYTRRHFSVAPEVARLRVLGGYPLKDPDRVLAMLQSVLPIRVRKPLPWWVSIEAK